MKGPSGQRVNVPVRVWSGSRPVSLTAGLCWKRCLIRSCGPEQNIFTGYSGDFQIIWRLFKSHWRQTREMLVFYVHAVHIKSFWSSCAEAGDPALSFNTFWEDMCGFWAALWTLECVSVVWHPVVLTGCCNKEDALSSSLRRCCRIQVGQELWERREPSHLFILQQPDSGPSGWAPLSDLHVK